MANIVIIVNIPLTTIRRQPTCTVCMMDGWMQRELSDITNLRVHILAGHDGAVR
jgi:hypothetical protein